MPLSPRLLRPSSSFTPRSISGLALWLDASAAGDLYQTDAGPASPVTSPLDISGCVAWWDASDASTLFQNSNGTTAATAANDPVGYVADKSGGGKHLTQSTSSARPVISPATLNGKQVIRLDGSNDFYSFTGTAIQSVFAVVSVNMAAGKVLGSLMGNSSGSPDLRRDANASPSTRWRGTSTDGSSSDVNDFANPAGSVFRVNSVGTPTVAEQVWHIVTAVRGTGTATLDRVGQAVGTRELGGDIAEIICYGGAVSSADVARIEKYLSQKWGIAAVTLASTAASDPLGCWRDRSPSGKHAAQATANNRPTIAPVTRNGKAVIRFDGLDDFLTFTDSSIQSIFMVLNVQSQESRTLNSIIGQRNPNVPQDNAAVGIRRDIDGNGSATTKYRGITGANSGDFTNPAGSTFRINSSATDLVNDGVWHVLTAIRAGSPLANINCLARHFQAREFGGDMAEIICYDSALSNANRDKVEKYLAAKWGIQLPLTVSNPDAQDWITRVYANGATVSADTAIAVNTFCNAIDAASLRDRFYRLNLFAGTGLNACLVPLYRGPTKYTGRNLLASVANATQFSGAGWSALGTVATKNGSVSAPDGSNTATSVTLTAGVVRYTTAWTANSTGTVSLWARKPAAGGATHIRITTNNTAAWNTGISEKFALTTSWQRISAAGVLSNSSSVHVIVGSGTVSGGNDTDCDGTVELWNPQIEYGSLSDYEGPQYGNATDTNNFFASGDYVETGATGGLTSGTANTTKYLNTGLNASVAFASGNGHMSCYYRTINAPTGSQTWRVMGLLQESPAQYYYMDVAATGGVGFSRSAFGGSSSTFGYPKTYSGSTLILTTRRSATDLADYYGASEVSQTANTTSTPPSSSIYVFAEDRNGTGALTHASGRIGMYSIGASMTTAQISAYRSIVDTFQATLSRNT